VRILCVDDDRLVLTTTAELIRSLGYEVVEASSYAEAVGAMSLGSTIDLLITDLKLGDGCGLELAQQALALRPAVHVIYFTGSDLPLPPGTSGVRLSKPCTLRDLRDVLAAYS